MATSETRYAHIVLDEARIPYIDGTTMKVVELVTPQQAYGWSPEELAFPFPHLTLGQIYSALAYYWDHRQELDDDIMRRLRLVDELQKRSPRPLSFKDILRAKPVMPDDEMADELMHAVRSWRRAGGETV